MEYSALLIFSIVGMALLFDFLNGFHDAANSIATIVSTRVLRPHWAVMWAAFFNCIAFLFFELHVANTIGTGIIDPTFVDPLIVLSALLGAIFWNIFTWFFGLPSSSSHALIGGLGGAGIAKAGFGSLKLSGFVKIGLSIVISPLLGFILALILMTTISLCLYRAVPMKVDRWARRAQLVSASLYSLGHGVNDAQKTMGIIAVLLFSTGQISHFYVPVWVVVACQITMGLGTLFGGWRIVRTMGMKITKLKPIGGFCAETGGALTLFLATALGIPVSTTHTITGAIMGVGAFTKFSAVRWGVAERIVWAWILTIPAAGIVSAATWSLCQYFLVNP